jgi:outer membrane protein TolC
MRASLEEILEVAVRQSPELRRAQLARGAAKEDAVAAELEQEWLASVELGGRQQRIDRPDPEPLQLTEELTVDGQATLAKRLPTGGAVVLNVQMLRRDQSFDISQLVDGQPQSREQSQNSAARAGLSLTQPLGRGLGGAAQAGGRRARVRRDSATSAAERAAAEALRDVVVTYWDLAYAAQAVEVAERSFALGKTQFDQTTESRRAGLVAANAVKAVEYQLAVREETLLGARLELRTRSMDLRRLVALDVEQIDQAILPSERFEIDQRQFDLDQALARSLLRNPELAGGAIERKAAELEVEVAEDRRKPKVDLAVDASLVGNGENFGTALGDVGSGGTYEIGARLSLSYELGASGSAAVRAAEKRRSAIKISVVERAYRVRAEVITAFDSITGARQRVALSDKAVALAGETLDAEQASFTAGRSSAYSVLDRQSELVRSELSRARAIADYHQAVARLELLTGDLFVRYGVEFAAR